LHMFFVELEASLCSVSHEVMITDHNINMKSKITEDRTVRPRNEYRPQNFQPSYK